MWYSSCSVTACRNAALPLAPTSSMRRSSGGTGIPPMGRVARLCATAENHVAQPQLADREVGQPGEGRRNWFGSGGAAVKGERAAEVVAAAGSHILFHVADPDAQRAQVVVDVPDTHQSQAGELGFPGRLHVRGALPARRIRPRERDQGAVDEMTRAIADRSPAGRSNG